MCDKDTCNDASCCGECEPWNCLEQQINDALATKEEQLQGYVGEAKDAAAESKASAEASAQSAAESKEFRDEAETAASTAVAAEGVVLGVANTLQDTADKLDQIADELGTAIAGIAVSSWFYTTVSENQTVIPVPADKNAVDVQSIYIEGTRQSPFRGFEFDKTAMTITLAEPLPLGLEIEIILGTYNSDNPNDFAHTLASDNGASLVGTSYGITVEEMLSLGRIVYPEMFGVGLASPTHDELFSSMFAALEAKDDTLLGTSLPYTVDLKGKVYTLYEVHTVDVNINIINGHLLMDGGQIIISKEEVNSRTRRVLLKDLKVRYVGTEYFADALIKVPRCYDSFVVNCDFWAGVSTNLNSDNKPLRARYGIWLGSRRAWGCGIIGGEFFGGETPCRIGYTNDHTGLDIGGATFHHGWVGNLMLCNPAGFNIHGCNIEHSENGAWSLGITSGTNADAGSTVINPAHGGKISGCYFYNTGNGTTGTDLAEAAVLVGYDLPGTLGWDIEGSLITSQNTAHSITVENSYIVSAKQKYAVKMRGLAALDVKNNKYTFSSTVPVAILYEGTCARSDCTNNRNQSTGIFDEVGYTSTSKPRIGKRSGTFLPVLVGSNVAGSLVYSTRGGDYTVDDDRCHLSCWLTVGSIATQPDGPLSITLPVAIVAGRRAPGSVDLVNILGNQSIQVSLNTSDTVDTTVNVTGSLDSDSAATLTATGSGTGTAMGTATGAVNLPNSLFGASALLLSGKTLQLRIAGANMQGVMIGAATAMEIFISYPVAGATYLG